MSARFHNTHKHEPAYYELVLRTLISCNTDAMSYSQMASVLNAQGTPTPTGLQWNAEHIKQLLKKVRAYKLYPSRIHAHLMELIFEEKLTLTEVSPLYRSRRHGTQ